ncbi:hypothetical protein SLG_29520 [Sphingobium sp. SYK-6]|uniref:hypothetical protein n=1 Tax=Sphingobium sp. (strain NBRC 103272 / SYK-6) TaxID=627192 RepID=UPI00022772F4|nr:hypothetical protein [Sphingobium sp. SYK-6]BAK67627.1 hypothetical protein SLG_29520 [Sphingobium sp. SYK-6]
MASHIPEGRLGRAFKAGIPIALVILAAKVAEGEWKIDRSGEATRLSWASQPFSAAADGSALRVTACYGAGCESWALAVSLPRDHYGVRLATAAGSLLADAIGLCPEQIRLRGPLALA